MQTDGTLSGAGDSDGPYRDAPELLGRLAASPTVRACWVKNLFRSGKTFIVNWQRFNEQSQYFKVYYDKN